VVLTVTVLSLHSAAYRALTVSGHAFQLCSAAAQVCDSVAPQTRCLTGRSTPSPQRQS